MLAQSFYSQKQLNGLSCPELITKVENEKGVIWGNFEPWKKQGEVWFQGDIVDRSFIFKDERMLIENLLNKTEE